MEFNSINLFNGLQLIVILVPNLLYAIKQQKDDMQKNTRKTPGFIVIGEEIGRYCCMFFLIFPVLVWKFSFAGRIEQILYYAVCGMLLAFYLLFWILYFHNQNIWKGFALAFIPSVLFLFVGIILNHVLLTVSAIVFGIFHIWITLFTHVSRETK